MTVKEGIMMNLTNVEQLGGISVQVMAKSVKEVEADAVIVLFSKSEWQNRAQDVPGGQLCKDAVECGLFQVEERNTRVFPVRDGNVRYLIAVGRKEDPLTTKDVRLMLANAAKEAYKLGVARVAVAVPEDLVSLTVEKDAAATAHALTEGFLLGAYQRVTYKLDAKPIHKFESLTLCGEQLEASTWQQGAEAGKAYAIGTTVARDLTNLPGNLLVPSVLADYALQLAAQYGFEAHVLDEQQIQEKGMGGLLGVGKGSVNPPRMIVLKYQGKEQWNDVFGLVGKGITFDTGGISLKKAEGMDDMICDMGGAATVLGTMAAIGQLQPKENVLCVIPSAENMPSSSAMKPGDVLTTYSGRTIEVLNTDAEGRLVLADGMTYAKELGASKLIDVATLTGAAVVALADITTGVVTNDETFMQELITASKRTGEYVWPLPSHPEYAELLKSDVADVRNSCGRGGGAITAGLFVGTFADGLPWIHLDIAGTAFLGKPRGVDPKGATGVMVRTITETIMSDL
ncbi:leucyl aminopeptidase [Paenibacillus sp. ACRRX]|uniref:leucyl aminopeptidase n=1 Tax=unclassified Paenibacillus TaxID=185978 RepID=UPI001EF573FE|nr:MULTISPECIES: leucyl aminopeptidase [unclassified Paenibacillus]MCG7409883.1 leucyl aminopeptidase [Paenibacillus sp. ACRRX]MDK8183051.1 leucyl aminopeptidase [Paenibacillus sp. UMB4589-SE434]